MTHNSPCLLQYMKETEVSYGAGAGEGGAGRAPASLMGAQLLPAVASPLHTAPTSTSAAVKCGRHTVCGFEAQKSHGKSALPAGLQTLILTQTYGLMGRDGRWLCCLQALGDASILVRERESAGGGGRGWVRAPLPPALCPVLARCGRSGVAPGRALRELGSVPAFEGGHPGGGEAGLCPSHRLSPAST